MNLFEIQFHVGESEKENVCLNGGVRAPILPHDSFVTPPLRLGYNSNCNRPRAVDEESIRFNWKLIPLRILHQRLWVQIYRFGLNFIK